MTNEIVEAIRENTQAIYAVRNDLIEQISIQKRITEQLEILLTHFLDPEEMPLG